MYVSTSDPEIIKLFHAYFNWVWNFNNSQKVKCWKLKIFLASRWWIYPAVLSMKFCLMKKSSDANFVAFWRLKVYNLMSSNCLTYIKQPHALSKQHIYPRSIETPQTTPKHPKPPQTSTKPPPNRHQTTPNRHQTTPNHISPASPDIPSTPSLPPTLTQYQDNRNLYIPSFSLHASNFFINVLSCAVK